MLCVYTVSDYEDSDLVARSRSALVELAQVGEQESERKSRGRRRSSGSEGGRKRTRTLSGGEAVALAETVGAGMATVDAGDVFEEAVEEEQASAAEVLKIFQV